MNRSGYVNDSGIRSQQDLRTPEQKAQAVSELQQVSYTDPVKFTATNRYGCGPDDEDDVYTVEEFLAHVDSKSFIDYDGFGHPVKDNKADESIWIYPSTARENLPPDATHVVWFNR